MQPLLKYQDSTLRTTTAAAVDVVDLAVGEAHSGARGHFKFSEKEESSPENMELGKQEEVWAKSLKWAGITREDTALASAFES